MKDLFKRFETPQEFEGEASHAVCELEELKKDLVVSRESFENAMTSFYTQMTRNDIGELIRLLENIMKLTSDS